MSEAQGRPEEQGSAAPGVSKAPAASESGGTTVAPLVISLSGLGAPTPTHAHPETGEPPATSGDGTLSAGALGEAGADTDMIPSGEREEVEGVGAGGEGEQPAPEAGETAVAETAEEQVVLVKEREGEAEGEGEKKAPETEMVPGVGEAEREREFKPEEVKTEAEVDVKPEKQKKSGPSYAGKWCCKRLCLRNQTPEQIAAMYADRLAIAEQEPLPPNERKAQISALIQKYCYNRVTQTAFCYKAIMYVATHNGIK
ncbi:hypothetical protein KIPB_002497, partial [Kipferlia bialata]|eukprot:g2497.t1